MISLWHHCHHLLKIGWAWCVNISVVYVHSMKWVLFALKFMQILPLLFKMNELCDICFAWCTVTNRDGVQGNQKDNYFSLTNQLIIMTPSYKMWSQVALLSFEYRDELDTFASCCKYCCCEWWLCFAFWIPDATLSENWSGFLWGQPCRV